jgi:PAS domain-containing protein
MTMSDEKRVKLTLGQQRFLERMQQAQNEGVSLPDYYRAHGLSMAMLYKVRRQLVQKFDVSLTISPILDAQGRIVGASKIARDISERRRTPQAAKFIRAAQRSPGSIHM